MCQKWKQIEHSQKVVSCRLNLDAEFTGKKGGEKGGEGGGDGWALWQGEKGQREEKMGVQDAGNVRGGRRGGRGVCIIHGSTQNSYMEASDSIDLFYLLHSEL